MVLLTLIAAAAAITVALTAIDEINQGTPIEELPAEILNPENIVQTIANNPITKPLAEIGELFADTGEAIVGLLEIVIFLITPNPANITDFKALKKSFKFIVSIPLVQMLVLLVLVGGTAATGITALIKNPELMNRILTSVEGFFFEKND